MIARWMERNLREALNVRRGVHLTGVRQCGKTTLAEAVADGAMRYVTLDETPVRLAAISDPSGFVVRTDKKRLLSMKSKRYRNFWTPLKSR